MDMGVGTSGLRVNRTGAREPRCAAQWGRAGMVVRTVLLAQVSYS